MEILWNDIKFGIRMLAKNPGFTAVAILTLALGIGANAAIFSVVNAVLLRPLPYKDPSQLVKVWGKLEKHGLPQNWISEPEWWELKDTNQAFSAVAAYSSGDGANLTREAAEPIRVTAASSTAELFPVLEVHPHLGRVFSAEEDLPGRNHVVLLSYNLWKNLFAGNPAIVGSSVRLDSESYTVVGVLPDGFDFSGKNDIWTPLALDRNRPRNRGSHYLEVLGRLKPGVTAAQGSEDMNRFALQLAREYPDYYTQNSGWGVFLIPLQQELVGSVRTALYVLLGAVGCVLLIACSNIANLLLARASVREKEVSIRVSLGASPWRLVRQLLTESVLLAVVGGGIGLLLAGWGVKLLKIFAPNDLPRMAEIGLDARVLVFTFMVAVLTGLMFGLAPAFHAVRSNLQDLLKEGGRGSSAGLKSQWLRGALVVVEVALALMLLVGAGLLIRSFRHLIAVNPGFQTEHLLTLQLSLPPEKYRDDAPITSFYRQALDRVRGLPGVEAAGAITHLPLSGANSSGSVFIEESAATNLMRVPRFSFPFLEIDRRIVTPGYFEAMRIPLIEGRLLTDADNDQAPYVAVVDIDFARHIWQNQDPLGKHIAIDIVPQSKPPTPRWRTVVGVVGHVKHYALDTQGREQAYFPQGQSSKVRQMYFVARTRTSSTNLISAIRSQVQALDPDQPVYDESTMDELLATSLAQPRLNLLLMGVFAVLSMALAAVGIYGVIAYSVSERTHEIGIRMALGAQPKDVWRLVLGSGARLTAAGLVLGLAGALALTRLGRTLLYEVSPIDPATILTVSVILAVTGLIACYLPAKRATRVDPVVSLRYE